MQDKTKHLYKINYQLESDFGPRKKRGYIRATTAFKAKAKLLNHFAKNQLNGTILKITEFAYSMEVNI